MTDWHGSGMSVMEVSHRSKAFIAVAEEAEADLRELLGRARQLQGAVPAGRRHGQFAADPAEPATPESTVDYVNTGAWSKKAIGEAKRYCKVQRRGRRGRVELHRPCRRRARCKLTPDAAYVHYTPNETIGGVEFHYVPETGAVPLVADMSSTILSRPIDVVEVRPHLRRRAEEHRPVGPRVVIVRDDLLGKARPGTPSVWTTRRWPTKARCSTRRRPSAGTSRASCSSGSRGRAA